MLRAAKGTVLILGLILLGVMTLIGISSMSYLSQTEKMTMNARDMKTSFQAAEAALKEGENWLKAQTTKPLAVSTCTTPPCKVFTAGTLTNMKQQTSSWWSTNGNPVSATIPSLTTQPYYLIQELMFVPSELSPSATSSGSGYYYYQVFSIGVGTSSNAVTVLESVYSVIF